MSRTKYLYNALPGRGRAERRARHEGAGCGSVRARRALPDVARAEPGVPSLCAAARRQAASAQPADGQRRRDLLGQAGALSTDRRQGAARRRRAHSPTRTSRRASIRRSAISATSISTRGGQFWSDFAPRFVELFELWQETKEPRYLAAAQKGARAYASYAWYFPRIPGRRSHRRSRRRRARRPVHRQAGCAGNSHARGHASGVAGHRRSA